MFSHWDGKGLVDLATFYVCDLHEKAAKNGISYPLDRCEPNTVMVDFIRHLTKGLERVDSNYYLGKTKNDGDNSDNGHHVIRL